MQTKSFGNCWSTHKYKYRTLEKLKLIQNVRELEPCDYDFPITRGQFNVSLFESLIIKTLKFIPLLTCFFVPSGLKDRHGNLETVH